MIDERLVDRTRKIVIDLVAEPPDITEEVAERLATVERLEEAGFTHLSGSIQAETLEQLQRRNEAQWLHEKQGAEGRIVLDLGKNRWQEEHRYSYLPKFTIPVASITLSIMIILLTMSYLSGQFVESLPFLIPVEVLLGLLTLIAHLPPESVIVPVHLSTMFRIPIQHYPFQVPQSIADTVVAEKPNYRNFEVLIYANQRDIEKALPKPRPIDPILLGLSPSKRYGVVLAMWGTDLEQLEQEIVKRKLS
jgi:hypothetical protein